MQERQRQREKGENGYFDEFYEGIYAYYYYETFRNVITLMKRTAFFKADKYIVSGVETFS